MVSAPSFASLSFEDKLDRLAEVAVRVGLSLREGQELVLTAPIDALPLVRRITDHAYRAGALLVLLSRSGDLLSGSDLPSQRRRSARLVGRCAQAYRRHSCEGPA